MTSLTVSEKEAGWIEIPVDFGRGMPMWVYDLRRGDELLRSDDRVCIFERSMQKNIAFRDDIGKEWCGTTWSFKAWRRGDPSNLIDSNLAKYKTDEEGARSLQPGDMALFILGPRRIYVARIDGNPNSKTISACNLNGKRYRYPLDTFVTKLPAKSFPAG